MKINRLQNVDVLARAAGAGTGEVRLTTGLDTVNHVVDGGPATSSIVVPLVALDDLVSPGQPIALVKIDVEGFEAAVLTGAARLLRENSVLAWIVELNGLGSRYGVDNRTLMELFKDHGYGPYRYHADRRVLGHAETGDVGDGWNLIFVKDRLEAMRRLEQPSGG